jgi:hypothetical protein
VRLRGGHERRVTHIDFFAQQRIVHQPTHWRRRRLLDHQGFRVRGQPPQHFVDRCRRPHSRLSRLRAHHRTDSDNQARRKETIHRDASLENRPSVDYQGRNGMCITVRPPLPATRWLRRGCPHNRAGPSFPGRCLSKDFAMPGRESAWHCTCRGMVSATQRKSATSELASVSAPASMRYRVVLVRILCHLRPRLHVKLRRAMHMEYTWQDS